MTRYQRAAALGALATVAMLAGCSQAPLDFPRTASSALADPQETRLGLILAPRLSEHPGKSGFYLLATGPEGLAGRLAAIQLATRTIDAQYFILDDDCAGNLFLSQMLAAADRGVRVRLLLDDWNQPGDLERLAGIDAHPNIEVRLFNPLGNPRNCQAGRLAQYLAGPSRLKKRMHNKSLIVDNTVAVAGGRNIADAYFSTSSDYAFADMDILMAGPAAREASAAFDEYWNDRLSLPVRAFVRDDKAGRMENARRQLEQREAAARSVPYIRDMPESELRSKLEDDLIPWIWAKGEYLHDSPAKVVRTMEEDPSAYMAVRLRAILEGAKGEILMSSPYLVPGKAGVARIRGLLERGVKLNILTNSLASTDEVATFGGYQRYRKDMLRAGVNLFELKPAHALPASEPPSTPGEPYHRGLHAKVFVMDRAVVFVGSFNFDPRSARLDTQDGVVVWSEELAGQVAERGTRAVSPAHSYQVVLRESRPGARNKRLVWLFEKDGNAAASYQEPDTRPSRRCKAWFLALIAPETWL